MAESLSKQLPDGDNTVATGGWVTITDTATLGEIVHSGHATDKDEVWLWATNESTATETLTLEWGSASTPQVTKIPPQELPVLVVPGWIITNDDLTAFASTAGVITVHVYVNRITTG